MSIRELEAGEFFSAGLRKPDFQRETSEWDAKRVIGLVRTFVEDQLIPGVILWKNKDLIFVIDGSHRLSALLAWVLDDYGDGAASRAFFGTSIPDEQLVMAERARAEIAKEVGSYADHRKAASNPEAFGPDLVARARRLSTLTLDLQWVRGDATRAEDSFIRINQQAATITPQELELIKDRRKPMAIGARAIRQKGTGHEYWKNFSSERQAIIRQHAVEIHDILFTPTLSYPVKSADLPAGGSVTAGTALRMIYDFIAVAVGLESAIDKNEDKDGSRTITFLIRTKKLAKRIISNDASSLGLHPAVYFYSWTGKQLPVMFLAIARLVVHLEQNNAMAKFTKAREEFESFLVANRALLNQVIRKFGAGNSGRQNLYAFYEDVLMAIVGGAKVDGITAAIQQSGKYSYLQPDETSYDGVRPTRFSKQVKAGVVIQTLLESAPRCAICSGLVPTNAISVDHIERKKDGGASVQSNAQITHPYCNTGYKEYLTHIDRKAGAARAP